jgi:hypothetical protein
MPRELTRRVKNRSFLQPTKYQLEFARSPHMTYFCQAANLPGLSLNEVPRSTPFVDLFVPGEKAIYDTLNITFLVDEDLRSWFEIHDWIRGLTFPENFTEYKTTILEAGPFGKQYSDCAMTILTNSNKPNIRIKFKDCFPTTISSVIFSSQDTSKNVLTADATFRFSYFNVERIT